MKISKRYKGKKMKKLLLSLGTIAAMVMPIATIVACGSAKQVQVGFKDLDGNDGKAPALSELATAVQAATPALDVTTVENIETNGNTIRFTYSLDSDWDEPENSNVDVEVDSKTYTRITLNLKSEKIVKVETKIGTDNYSDVTKTYEIDETSIKMDIELANNEIKGIPITPTTGLISVKNIKLISLDNLMGIPGEKEGEVIDIKDLNLPKTEGVMFSLPEGTVYPTAGTAGKVDVKLIPKMGYLINGKSSDDIEIKVSLVPKIIDIKLDKIDDVIGIDGDKAGRYVQGALQIKIPDHLGYEFGGDEVFPAAGTSGEVKIMIFANGGYTVNGKKGVEMKVNLVMGQVVVPKGPTSSEIAEMFNQMTIDSGGFFTSPEDMISQSGYEESLVKYIGSTLKAPEGPDQVYSNGDIVNLELSGKSATITYNDGSWS